MLERLATAIRGWKDPTRTVENAYGTLLGDSALRSEKVRDAAIEVALGAPAANREGLVAAIANRCKARQVLVAAEAVGPRAVLAFWRRGLTSEDPLPPKTEKDIAAIVLAARAVFASPLRKKRWDTTWSACIAAIDLLGDMHEMKPLLAELEKMIDADEKELREWFDSTRSRAPQTPPDEPPTPEATADPLPYGWSEEHLSDANRAIELPGGARAFLAARPDDDVWLISALETRARDSRVAPMFRVLALTELADVAPDRAAALADATRDDAVLAPIARPLSRFRSLAAAEEWLASNAIRTTSFDTETDLFPNRQDARLAELAELVAPLTAMDPWFDEIPPLEEEDEYDEDEDQEEGGEEEDTRDDADERLDGFYRLRAYVPKGSYEVISPANGDWQDVPAMIGMLNRICEDAGLPHRYLVFERDHSQQAWIAAGPADALERAVTEGALVPAAAASSAADRGSAFEDAVLGPRRR